MPFVIIKYALIYSNHSFLSGDKEYSTFDSVLSKSKRYCIRSKHFCSVKVNMINKFLSIYFVITDLIMVNDVFIKDYEIFHYSYITYINVYKKSSSFPLWFSVNKIYTKINEFTFLILKLIMYVIINNL